ncbi:MAG: NFACT RNA binding domain-containing protein [archaeon]|nr:NFACT RNA binding domain-containing protein [archaeon]
MKIEIDLNKSIQENAGSYYDFSKKAKKKLGGLAKGMHEVDKKISEEGESKGVQKKLVKKREKKWYEKYHWFFTSEGFLVVGGRDAKSNEQVVKKIMVPGDVYFHADIQGAPHTILKADGKIPGEISKKEAAIFAACFSKAWREQLAGLDVYSANPDQVSKKAPSGESLGTGAFMIHGKREWFKKTPLQFAIGFKKYGDSLDLFSGPESAVKKNSDYLVKVFFGKDSKGACAKKIRKQFLDKSGNKFEVRLEDIEFLLPSGGLSLGKA